MNKFLFIIVTCIIFGFYFYPALAGADEIPAPAPLADWSIEGNAEKLTGAQYLSRAEEGYDNGEYEQSLADLELALPLLDNPKDKAKAHRLIAFIDAAFGKTELVYKEFVESLNLDRETVLDPNVVSPKIYESFLKARDEVVREGTLICNCDPSGAEVYLDDVLLGEAPVKKEHIPEGEHTLTLKKRGYESSTGRITIKKDVTLTVDDKMVEAMGEFVITTEPPGAAVTFDGAQAGTTPVSIKKAASGAHRITLSRDYFDKVELDEELGKSEKKEVHAALRRRLVLIKGEGLDEFAGDIKSKLDGFSVAATDIKKICAAFRRRGLDVSSLDFVKMQKACLELEDSAVLSSILEQDGSELALSLTLDGTETRKRLKVNLYGLTSGLADTATFEAEDVAGLREGLGGYIKKWLAQKKGRTPTIGARVVDRA